MKYNIISELISLHIVALTSYSDTTHVNFQERVILLVINHGLAAAPLRNPWTDWDGAPEFHQVPFCAVAPSIIVRQPRHCDEIANASPSYIRPSQQGLALSFFLVVYIQYFIHRRQITQKITLITMSDPYNNQYNQYGAPQQDHGQPNDGYYGGQHNYPPPQGQYGQPPQQHGYYPPGVSIPFHRIVFLKLITPSMIRFRRAVTWKHLPWTNFPGL